MMCDRLYLQRSPEYLRGLVGLERVVATTGEEMVTDARLTTACPATSLLT